MPDDQNDQDQDPGRLRQMMEDANAERAKAEAELAQMRSREMFRDAGADPQNPLHAAAMRGYQGDSDPEAIKSYVADLGLTKPADPPRTDPTSDEERRAADQIANAARDSGTPLPNPDRRDQIRKEMDNAARRGDNAELDRLAREFSKAGGFPVKEAWQ